MKAVLILVILLLLAFCLTAFGQVPAPSKTLPLTTSGQGEPKNTAGFTSVPLAISYQGLMTTSSGTPVQDGNYDIQFDLYEASVGGTSEWTETHNGVAVSRGTFNIILGATTSLNNFNFNRQMYLEVTATAGPAGPSYPITFSPRAQLTSAPTALAPWTVNSGNIYYNNGNVGIGTNSPSTILDVRKDVPNDLGPIISLSNGGGGATSGGAIDFKNLNVTSPTQFRIRTDDDGNSSAHLAFLARPQGPGGSSVIEHMRITSRGNIGIGTTTPSQKLHVASTGSNTSRLLMESQGSVAIRQALTLTAGQGRWSTFVGVDGSYGIASANDLFDDFTNRFVINHSSGNVGIGTITPTAKLHIGGTPGIDGIRFPDGSLQTSGGVGSASSVSSATDALVTGDNDNNGSGDVRFVTGLSDKMRITNGGNVGIGTASPSAKLQVTGSETTTDGKNAAITISNTASGGANWYLRAGATGTVTPAAGFSIADDITYRFVISGIGNVGIGNYIVTPSNIITVEQNSSTDPIADAWTTYSSRRWKTNIKTIERALDKIQLLRGVRFDWKADGKHDIGLIAEEVGEVIPEVVAYEENSKDARSVDYARLVAVLIEGMKEQQKELEELRAMVKSLVEQQADNEKKSLGELK
ncbi:MAG: tail fiber domain-containing protein [Ignavibacteriae bacterium]|nr:tail fiber domain-containing protein [Ignavibacteriota bacterium]